MGKFYNSLLKFTMKNKKNLHITYNLISLVFRFPAWKTDLSNGRPWELPNSYYEGISTLLPYVSASWSLEILS